jgi:hypothetical protein
MKLLPVCFASAALLLVACDRPVTRVFAPPSSSAPARALTLGDAEIVMSELHNPRGLTFGPDGALYVAEAGTGGNGACLLVVGLSECYGATGSVSRLWHGQQERVVTGLPSMAAKGGQAEGPNGISMLGLGDAYVTIGLEGDPTKRDAAPELGGFARIVRLSASALRGHGGGHNDNDWEFVANLGSYEIERNPDCGVLDSNPFGVLAEPGHLIIADAGSNSLIELAANGDVSTFLSLPSRNTKPIRDDCPLPDGYPTVQPRETVPTSVVKGPDGAYYVGQLAGVPLTVGAARVFRFVPGSAPEVYLTGFTWIVAMTFDDAGNLYVLQYSDGPNSSFPGSLIRVAPDGSRTTVVTGLHSPTGVTIGPDGAIYVSHRGQKIPKESLGEVLRFEP